MQGVFLKKGYLCIIIKIGKQIFPAIFMKKIYCSNFGDETKTFFKGTLFQIHPPVLKDNSD
jgi:hypothetical protein